MRAVLARGRFVPGGAFDRVGAYADAWSVLEDGLSLSGETLS